MTWPTSPQYNEAVQGLRSSMSDEELRGGEVACTTLGLPMLWSGNFADVYKIHCPKSGNTWALKCFTREVRGLQDRYRSIAAHLEQAQLPFTVDFQYLEQGIRIAGAWFPALKMRWVEGLTLSEFVEEHLDRPKNLKMLLDLWPKLAARLREAGIAHADLQHGNVLLVPQQRGALALRLIDYDGMYVPALSGTRSGEVGHPAYQHPQRSRDGTYSTEVDRFSHLAIYTAVHCLTVGRRPLWRQLNNGDNLLFRESDYARPGQSEAFRTLWAHGDPGVRALVGRLVLACQWPLEQAPLLDEILVDGKILALSRKEVTAVEDALSAAAPRVSPLPTNLRSVPGEGRGEGEPAAAPVVPLPEVVPVQSRPATAEGTLPSPVPGIAVEPRHRRVFAQLLRAMLAPVRGLDKFLLGMIGPDNAILHKFLRLMAVVVLVAGVAVGWMFYRQWRAQVAAQLASEPGNVTSDEPEEPASVTPDASSEPGRVAPEATGKTPHLQPIPPQTVEAGKPLAVAVSVEDADQWQGKLRFTLDEDAPSGATIDPQTGAVTWKPPQDQSPGDYDFTVSVEAPGGRKDETAFSVTVTSPLSPGRHSPALRSVEFDLDKGVTLEMLLIQAGSFTMGDDNGNSNERPAHKVTITKAFYLGKYEVTQEQWQAVMGNDPSSFKGPNNPVENVSWDHCQEFLKRLNARFAARAGTFRLPTEAEWEYACRAGSTGKYCFDDGESRLEDYSWYRQNSGKKTHPVGEKKPNAWGLYDMHGNVWEWCGDWYGRDYYKASASEDPAGPASGTSRVYRGGDLSLTAADCRAAIRNHVLPGTRRYYLGVRACLVPVDTAEEAPAPLRLQPIAQRSVEQGKQLTVAIAVANPKQWNGKLRFSLQPNAAAGAAIDPQTGAFTWTPPEGLLGNFDVTVSVDGPDGQKDQATFTIGVIRPSAPPAKELAIDLGSGVTLEMILIPAGSFTMGDASGNGNEKPPHKVNITKPFYLGKYEVTQQQWEAVMGDVPVYYKKVPPKNPVEHVTWDNCQEFFKKLNETVGGSPSPKPSPRGRGAARGPFRLPTEAEWEYACRAGSTSKYCFGNDVARLGEYAWYADNSQGRTHPVGEKKPNAWGLYDMHGNVWEWCGDFFDSHYYKASPPEDPPGPSPRDHHVLRGGSWYLRPITCRSAFRNWARWCDDSGEMHDNFGFRAARTVD